MVLSGLSLYIGAAIAVGLFEVFSPVVVAWFRVGAAGLVLAAIYRPRLEDFVGRTGINAAIYGIVTMSMNMVFYQAINHVPLGTAVAVEFLGPIVIAAWGSKNLRDWLALLSATIGVLVISGATWSVSGGGILWALGAGALWAAYIVAGSRISAGSRSAMAVGFLYAGAAGLPMIMWLWPDAQPLPMPQLIGLAVGLGVLSAAIPYSLDQAVLRLAGPAYFAILQAILPLVAAIVGAFALHQWLSWQECFGIACVILAVMLRKP